VITMLMSILSTTMLTKNKIDHENRLYDESYYISEYIQSRVFDLGVRSIEDITPDGSDDQIIELRHEYDVMQSKDSGVIYRDYSDAESFILHYDASEQSLHYGNADAFDRNNSTFLDPEDTRINSTDVAVEDATAIGYDCILYGPIYDDETDTTVNRCVSAIMRLNITLTFRINDEPLFKPMTFESTIVF
ncbi:MAG: hypothetical protein ACOCSM_03630, partial [Bacillota bacterium]